MSYETWVSLFGKPTIDEAVRKALKDEGIDDLLSVGRSETSVMEEFKGMMVEFRSVEVIPNLPETYGEGVGILESVSMWLADEDELYEGPLPHGISRDDTQETLRAKLGPPDPEFSDDESDEWVIDGINVRADYTDDYSAMTGLSLILMFEGR